MNKYVDFRGKKIAYDVMGSGKTLVLLHGFIESREIWDDFARILSRDFTVIAIDLPGHGESEVLAEVHSMQLMAESVKAVLSHEGVQSAVITGHSMGGYVTLEFAGMFPEMISGMVLFHSQAAPDSEETKENRRRTIQIVMQNRAGFIRQFIPDLFAKCNVESNGAAIGKLTEIASRMSREAIIAAISGMRERTGGMAVLQSAGKPVLFIAGKEDPRIPAGQVMAQAQIPGHAEILLLDRVGHMGYLEAPEITLQALRHFTLRCFGE